MPQTETERDYQRRYYAQNKERIKVRVREWRTANPEAKKAQDSRYRQRHRDKAVAATRRWYEANSEYAAQKTREWTEANPEKRREICRKHASRRRAQMRFLPADLIEPSEVFIRDKGVCGICHERVEPDSWHLDHIIPLARGGNHTYENVQVAHPRCNWKKGAR